MTPRIELLPLRTRIMSQACYLFPDVASCVTGAVDALDALTRHVVRVHTRQVLLERDLQSCLLDVVVTACGDLVEECGPLGDDMGCHNFCNDNVVGPIPRVDGALGCMRRLLAAVWKSSDTTSHGEAMFVQQLRCAAPHPWFTASCVAALSRCGTLRVQIPSYAVEASATLASASQDVAPVGGSESDALPWLISIGPSSSDVDEGGSGTVVVELKYLGVFEPVPLRHCVQRPLMMLSPGDAASLNRVAQHMLARSLLRFLNTDTGGSGESGDVRLSASLGGPRRYSLDLRSPTTAQDECTWMIGMIQHAYCFLAPANETDAQSVGGAGTWEHRRCGTSDAGVVMDVFLTRRPDGCSGGGRSQQCVPGLIVIACKSGDRAGTPSPVHELLGADHPVCNVVAQLSALRAVQDKKVLIGLVIIREERLTSNMRGVRAALEAAVLSSKDATPPTIAQILTQRSAFLAPANAHATPTPTAYPLSLSANATPPNSKRKKSGYLRAQGIVRRVDADHSAVPSFPKTTAARLNMYTGGSRVPDSVATLRHHLPTLTVAEWLTKASQQHDLAAITPHTAAPHHTLPPSLSTDWRGVFSSAHVVGVWDKKCIVLASSTPHEGVGGSHPQQLYLCDQHAIHERSRLEYFVRHVASFISSEPSRALPHHPVPYTHAHDCMHLIEALTALGWTISVAPTPSRGVNDRDAPAAPIVTGYPRITLEGFAYDISSMEALTNAIEELRDVGAGRVSAEPLACKTTIIPSSFLQILVSRSCRGAVMFGDILTTDEANLLVRSATTYTNKFLECSHGRPSFASCSAAPIGNLTTF